MRTYVKNYPAKFHLDPIWNHGAFSFIWRNRPINNKNNIKNNKMSSDVRSVADPKIIVRHFSTDDLVCMTMHANV